VVRTTMDGYLTVLGEAPSAHVYERFTIFLAFHRQMPATFLIQSGLPRGSPYLPGTGPKNLAKEKL
jgi:hypothetical protein